MSNYEKSGKEKKSNISDYNNLSIIKDSSEKLVKINHKKMENLSQNNSMFHSIERNNITFGENNTIDFSKPTNSDNISRNKSNLILNNKKLSFPTLQLKNRPRNISIKLIKKNNSINELKSNHSLYFKNMIGREDLPGAKVKNFAKKYYPSYNYIFPHVPSFFYNNSKNENEQKKFLINKLIRSYKCDAKFYISFCSGNINNLNKSNHGLI